MILWQSMGIATKVGTNDKHKLSTHGETRAVISPSPYVPFLSEIENSCYRKQNPTLIASLYVM